MKLLNTKFIISLLIIGAFYLPINAYNYLDDVDNIRLYASQTLHAWIEGLSAEQRELFVEKVYEIISESNAETLSDLVKPGNIHLIMKALNNANSETKKIITDALSQLRKIAFHSKKKKSMHS